MRSKGTGTWQITQSLATHCRQVEAGSFMYLAVAYTRHRREGRNAWTLTAASALCRPDTDHCPYALIVHGDSNSVWGQTPEHVIMSETPKWPTRGPPRRRLGASRARVRVRRGRSAGAREGTSGAGPGRPRPSGARDGRSRAARRPGGSAGEFGARRETARRRVQARRGSWTAACRWPLWSGPAPADKVDRPRRSGLLARLARQ